jgi:ubiquinone/menaquinone biosynthesis C-methylase UbiE
MSRRNRILKHYEPRIAPEAESHEVLDWFSAESQRARFLVLADHVPLEGRSLLDVGCGLGDLWAFLNGRDIKVRYTGIDISPKMAAEASRRHPGAEFIVGDPFADGLGDRRFDVAFCSGIFNLNLGNNRLFLPTAVRALMDHVDEALVFNLLHQRTPGQTSDYAYFDPDEVLSFLAQTGWQGCLIEDYLPNDFTVVCHPPRKA